MVFNPTPISLLIFLSFLVSSFTAYASWQRHQTRGGLYFALSMTGLAFWVLAAALDYATVDLPLKIFLAKLESLGYNFAVAFMATFSVFYASHEKYFKKIWIRLLFVLPPFISVLLTWTNELHGLVWRAFVPNPQNPSIVDFVHGPGFTFVALVG